MCVVGHLFGLLISDIGFSPSTGVQQVCRHAHHRSTRWHWNLLLDLLACLLSFVSLFLMSLFRSFGARPPRFLSGARPSHVANSSLLLPQLAVVFPHRPVEPQLILHSPNVLEYLSRSGTLGFRVALLTSFVAHFSPRNTFWSHGCQPPLTSSTTLRIPTWTIVPAQAILAWSETFPKPNVVSIILLHNWLAIRYSHLVPCFQT